MKCENESGNWTQSDALICARVHVKRVKAKKAGVAPRLGRRATATWSYAVVIAVNKMAYRHRTRARERKRSTAREFEAGREKRNATRKVGVGGWAETEYTLLAKMNRRRFRMTETASSGTAWSYCCVRCVRRTAEKSFYAWRELPGGRCQDWVGPRRLPPDECAWDFATSAAVARLRKQQASE